MYEPEDILDQYRSFWVPKEVHDILRREKRRQKISMAKIIANLVIKEYGHENAPRKEEEQEEEQLIYEKV